MNAHDDLTADEKVELAVLLEEMRDLVWLGGGFPPDDRVRYFIVRLKGDASPESEASNATA